MIDISISSGNSKTGKIPAWSMTPGRTCSEVACKTCYRDGCYAHESEWRAAVKAAWNRNADAMLNLDTRTEAFEKIDQYLKKKHPDLFRIHVSGDFIDYDYFLHWMRVCANNPETRFLAFTKKYAVAEKGLQEKAIPGNVQIIFSAWPKTEVPNVGFPIAWMQDSTEDRVPESAIACAGHCENCGMCWSLSKIGRDVVFKKHGQTARKKK